MNLVLRIVSLNDGPRAGPSASFGAAGGSIGRAEGNTLVLEDEHRAISRRQAEVRAEGGGFVIANVGSGNVLAVGGQNVPAGATLPLRPGDALRIGGYAIEVVSDTTGADETTSFAADFSASPRRSSAGPAASPSPFGMPAASSADPFADLFGSASPAAHFAPPPASPFAPAAPSPAVDRLPDDFDPFAMPPPAAARPPPPASSASGFEDLIAAPPSAGSIDHLFGIGAPVSSGDDPLAAFLADTVPAPGASGAAALSTDPLALFGRSEDSRPPPPPEHAPDQIPELRGAFALPKPLPRPSGGAPPKTDIRVASPLLRPTPGIASVSRPVLAPPDPPARPTSPPIPPARPVTTTPSSPALLLPERTIPPGWTPDAIAVWNALCEGAGVRLAPPPNTGPQFVRVVGMIMRAAVEGTVQLMAVRHATRQELHAQVTQIQPKNNNPLKFAPDGLSALEQLLQPAVRGFLPGPAAMTDAMNDLLGHAIGTMAGTRAALEGVLGRFAPQQLEAKLSGKSVLDNLVPAARKAKLWDLYLQHYEALREEAHEDFHALFGRAFLAAYEQQLERLRREKAAAGSRAPGS
ncbi:MAG: type VI secretion system-associated FHA domain protein TagH [Pseudomonadota bacterium]|nr:type VI secretion system-associated FHA domain protein TagH [Pseudomonadota bacterium]